MFVGSPKNFITKRHGHDHDLQAHFFSKMYKNFIKIKFISSHVLAMILFWQASFIA